MGSESRDKETEAVEKKLQDKEGFEKVDQMLEESKRAGLLHKLEKAADRIRKKLSGDGPDRGADRRGVEGVIDKRSGSVAGGATPTTGEAAPTPGEIPPTSERVYITKWDLLSDKSRTVALFYFDQFRWRYQYALITQRMPSAGYRKRKKKKKKKESDLTELFMVDDLFEDKDVDFSKVVGSML